MPYRIQVEVHRRDGTFDVVGEFLTDEDSLYGDDYPHIAPGVAQVLAGSIWTRITSDDEIHFWQEWVSQETFEQEVKAHKMKRIESQQKQVKLIERLEAQALAGYKLGATVLEVLLEANPQLKQRCMAELDDAIKIAREEKVEGNPKVMQLIAENLEFVKNELFPPSDSSEPEKP